MKVRTFSWRPIDGDPVVASWKQGAHKIEDERSLMNLVPETIDQDGNFLLELVGPESSDKDWIAPLLDRAFDGQGEEVAQYLTMPRPSPSFTTFKLGSDREIDDVWTTNYRVLSVVDLINENSHPKVILVERKLRVVVRKTAFVIAWEVPGGFPEVPRREFLYPERPIGLPGRLSNGQAEQMREQGNLDAIINFELGWASSGPGYLSQVRREGERESKEVGYIAEKFLQWAASHVQQVAEVDLPAALDRWESDLFEAIDKDLRRSRDRVQALAWFSGIVDLVGAAATRIGHPTSHEPMFHFFPCSFSSDIDESRERSEGALGQMRDRLRTDLLLLSTLSTTDTLELAQKSQASSDRLQRTVAVLGGVVLGPSLIASVFGANVRVPGEGKVWGFFFMCALMVASGVLLWAFLNRAGVGGAAKDNQPDQ